MSVAGKRILLVISGGIAAYKTPELVRALQKKGAFVRCVATKAALQFVTPTALAALTQSPVASDQFLLDGDYGMNHIRLTRECDLVVVAPLTANLAAKMANGIADDLASTLLLAADKPVLAAPAMNVMMWRHPATKANMATLRNRGVTMVGPDDGYLACNEIGEGRMADIADIVSVIEKHFAQGPLVGYSALVTSGPTHEAIDPVRYIANRSSGKQGHAIATALADLGAKVTLISGPVALAEPAGVDVVKVESAIEMEQAVQKALPADIAVFAAAVADWRVVNRGDVKHKKGDAPLQIELAENPDILAGVAAMKQGRPSLVIGFAAETNDVVVNAQSKLARKGCDLIIANDVSESEGVFGGDNNRWTVVGKNWTESWGKGSKAELSRRLADHVAALLDKKNMI